MGGAIEGTEGNLPVLLPLPHPQLMVIKCSLVTMQKCDLLNVIFCKTKQISVIFVFLNIKKQTNLRFSLNV